MCAEMGGERERERKQNTKCLSEQYFFLIKTVPYVMGEKKLA